jgi:beta-N-acetylhexosaminidase
MSMTDPALRALALRTILASFPGSRPPDWARKLLGDGLAGYVLFGFNVVDRTQLAELVGTLRGAHPDAIVGIDEEGGDVTRLSHHEGSPYPGNAALGAVDDPELTRQVYAAIGGQLADIGITLDLAPSVDVNTADDNPVIGTRSFGSEPQRVARHAAAAVAGLQSAGVAACAKHFPGHGSTEVDSHLGVPTVTASLDLLRTRELPPFTAAIGAGVKAVMTAHLRVPALTGSEPATLSRAALTDLLRGELGFDGVIVTDALEMKGASQQYGVPEAAVRSLAAGADLLCLGATVDAELVEATTAGIVAAIRAGRLPAEQVERAAARVADLVGWAAQHADRAVPDPDLGLAAARRALRVEGVLPALDAPLVVQLDSAATIAVGDVPWGVTPYLVEARATAQVIRIPAGSDGATAVTVAAAGAGRPIVVVARDTHRHPWARTFVEELAARHPAVVLVEMGWPAAWRPLGVQAYVATYGAGQVNAQAATERLLTAG